MVNYFDLIQLMITFDITKSVNTKWYQLTGKKKFTNTILTICNRIDDYNLEHFLFDLFNRSCLIVNL